MKAILTKQNSDGTYDETGTNNRRLVTNYHSTKTIIRYGVPDFWKGSNVRIEIFYGSLFTEPGEVVFI